MSRVRGMPGNSAQIFKEFKMNKFATVVRSPRAALAALAMSAATASHAALDASITGALDTAKTDGVALGGAVLVVIIAIAAFKLLRRGI